MKKNILSTLALIVSFISVGICAFTIMQLKNLETQISEMQKILSELNEEQNQTSSVDTSEENNPTETPASNQTSKEEYTFAQTLIGDWSGTNQWKTDVRMKVFDDSSVVIEDSSYLNDSIAYLYIGSIDNDVLVLEHRSEVIKPDNYSTGDIIQQYLSDPSSIELSEYYFADRPIKMAENIVNVNYGEKNSNGDVTVTFVRK